MSNQLSPRVKQMRDSLRRERLAREEQAGTRTKPGSFDPWLQKARPDDFDVRLQGVNDQPTTVSGDTNDPWLPDPKKDLVPADSQAAAGNSLHDVLEHAAQDDELLLEAAEQSLQETRHETGVQAARTRRAAQQLVSQVKDSQIAAIYKEFIARSKEAGAEYVPDDESLNFVAILAELVRMTGTAIYVDPDGDNSEEVGQALFQRHLLTVQNLLAAWRSLVHQGAAPVLYEGARQPSAAEKRAAQVRAATGDVMGAVADLYEVCLPSLKDANTEQEAIAILSDPANADVIFDCIVTVWSATVQALQAAYRDTRENRAALREMLGNRPATMPNIAAAWQQVRQGRGPASLPEISAAAANRAVTESELDQLDDDSIEQLLNATLRDRSRRIKKGL